MWSMTTQHQEAWVPTDQFRHRLVLVRRELDLTVKEAAARCGLHYATWSTWENGARPADLVGVVTAISSGLGVDRDWLLWGGSLGSGPGPSGGVPAVQATGQYAFGAGQRAGLALVAA